MNSGAAGKAKFQQFTAYCVNSWGTGYGVSKLITCSYSPAVSTASYLRISADVQQELWSTVSSPIRLWKGLLDASLAPSSSFFKYPYFIVELNGLPGNVEFRNIFMKTRVSGARWSIGQFNWLLEKPLKFTFCKQLTSTECSLQKVHVKCTDLPRSRRNHILKFDMCFNLIISGPT